MDQNNSTNDVYFPPKLQCECPYCFLCWVEETDDCRIDATKPTVPKTCEYCQEQIAHEQEPKRSPSGVTYAASRDLLLRRLTVMEYARLDKLPATLRGAVLYMLEQFRHVNHELSGHDMEITELTRDMTDLTNEVWSGDGK